MKKYTLLFYIIFVALITLNIFWILYLRLLPFIDLPFRLAASTIFRNFNSYHYSDFFMVPTIIKSNTFHLFFTSINIFPTVEIANKIYYCIYVIIFPVSVLLLIKKLKGNEWFSLFSFFLLYNHNVHWGFADYMMSVPVFLFYVFVLIKYFETKKFIFAITVSTMLILLFLFHFQTAIFGILVIIFLILIKKRKDYKFILRTLLILLPILILMMYAYYIDSSDRYANLFGYFAIYYLKVYLLKFPERCLNFFIMDNFFFFEGSAGAIFAASISLFILIPLIKKFSYLKEQIIKSFSLIKMNQIEKSNEEIVNRLNIKSKKEENIDYLLNNYFIPILFVSFLCYLLLPDGIPGQYIIYERFSVFIYLLLIIIMSLLYKSYNFRINQIVLIIFICAAYFTVISSYFFDFQNATKCFTEDIFPDSSENKVLAGIILDNNFRGRPVYTHFPMYNTVWKNGITTGLIDYRFGFFKRKADKSKLPEYNEFLDKNYSYNDEYNNVNYIIVRDKDDIKIRNFNTIKKCGEWRLLNVK